MLPMDLMGTMVLSGAVHDFTPLGRAEIGLFKKPDAPRPDITTVAKLVAVMKGGLDGVLFRSRFGEYAGGHERPAARSARSSPASMAYRSRAMPSRR